MSRLSITVLVGLAVLASGVAGARELDCVPYSGLPSPLGSCSLPLQGRASTAIAYGSDHLLVCHSTGLEVYDVSAAGDPHLAGQVEDLQLYGGWAHAAIVGLYAYLPGAPALIVDLSDQEQPSVATDLGEDFEDFAVHGNLVAGKTMYDTRLLDCSDPLAPVAIGTIDRRGDVEFVGDLLAVLGYGIWLYDISNPAAPVLVASIEYPVNQGYEYLAATAVLDVDLIGDQLILATNSFVETGSWIFGTYAITNNLGRRRVDLSIPGAPAEIVYLPTRTTNEIPPFLNYNLTRHGSYMIDGREVFDPLSADLAALSILPTSHPIPGGVVDLGDGRGAVCDNGNVSIIPLADPPVANIAAPLIHANTTHGSYTAAGVGDGFLAHLSTSGGDEDEYTSTLLLFAQPGEEAAEVEVYQTYNPPLDLACAGSTLVAGHRLFRVNLDLTLTEYASPLPWNLRQLYLKDASRLAVVVDNPGSADDLQLWDLSDLANPALLGQTALQSTLGIVRDVVWRDNLVLIAAWGGLSLVRTDDEANPAVAALLPRDDARWVAPAAPGMALLQAGTELVRVDVGNPDAPSVAVAVNAGVLTGRPLIQKGLAYTSVEGLLSLYDAETLAPLGTLAVDETIGHLGLWNGALVGAGRTFSGFAFLPPACEIELTPVDDMPVAAALLLGAAPNPFNPQTVVRFRLDREQSVRLAVFDARGRLTRELAGGVWAAGEHLVGWDGRDAAGRPAAAGVYLLRLETEVGCQTAKAALVK
ncbi:MAG: FlgD immunoglobulin-like domain containing protein [Candidatus Krumholzibacteria bacterium]|jgi:hypothetical protein|nr:FlgD immunoglobulin-like domain containing protein [Candidatus Krumholzibacteria bacterium]